MPHVASDSSDARGAVPARHLDYLASQECRDIEIEAAKTRGDRDVWQECARITRQHRGAGWAAIFSNGKSLERSADDGRLPGSILAAREALIEAINALIIKVCLGPSERLREALEKRIAKAQQELEAAPAFDLRLVNDDLDLAKQEAEDMVGDFLERAYL